MYTVGKMGIQKKPPQRNKFTHSETLQDNFLMKPVFNLKAYGGWSFVLASAVLWNDLPQSIKDSQSVETFKQKLKRHLFLQSYNGQ